MLYLPLLQLSANLPHQFASFHFAFVLVHFLLPREQLALLVPEERHSIGLALVEPLLSFLPYPLPIDIDPVPLHQHPDLPFSLRFPHPRAYRLVLTHLLHDLLYQLLMLIVLVPVSQTQLPLLAQMRLLHQVDVLMVRFGTPMVVIEQHLQVLVDVVLGELVHVPVARIELLHLP